MKSLESNTFLQKVSSINSQRFLYLTFHCSAIYFTIRLLMYIMYIRHVRFVHFLVSERSLAHFTVIVLLTSMRHKVASEVTFVCVSFTTHLADVSVDTQMFLFLVP